MLLVVCCVLFVVLFDVNCSLRMVCWLQCAGRWLLPVVRCALLAVFCVLCVVCCVLFGVWCVVCGLLLVVRCVVCVVCGSLF